MRIHDLSEEALTASSVYRTEEERIYRTRDIGPAMRQIADTQPHLLPKCVIAWETIREAVLEDFEERKAFWKKLRRVAEAPKDFEFHHTISIARQCFQIAVVNSFQESGNVSIDNDHVVDHTLQRLGLRGDFASFLRKSGFLDPQEVAPESSSEPGMM